MRACLAIQTRRERREDEYLELFGAAGFELASIILALTAYTTVIGMGVQDGKRALPRELVGHLCGS
jgi:hypothetical protein